MHVVVVGLMGAGKTTVGRHIATALGRPLVDSDATIESTVGRTSAAIAATEGVTRLHAIEHRLLLDAMARTDPVVVCAAASVADNEACVAALDAAYVVWLDIDPAILVRRIATPGHRRTLADPLADLRRQRSVRGPVFAAAADLVVNDAYVLDDITATVADNLASR